VVKQDPPILHLFILALQSPTLLRLLIMYDTHTSGVCRTISMSILTFYQITLFTDCLITLINYTHTPHCTYVDVARRYFSLNVSYPHHQ
jgi:hypothetical protein